jgi:hypothetical protein
VIQDLAVKVKSGVQSTDVPAKEVQQQAEGNPEHQDKKTQPQESRSQRRKRFNNTKLKIRSMVSQLKSDPEYLNTFVQDLIHAGLDPNKL